MYTDTIITVCNHPNKNVVFNNSFMFHFDVTPFQLKMESAYSWHDLDNNEYDCWPIEHPDEYNMIDCGGLEMAWIVRPPEKIASGQEFNVTYSVSVSDDFYDWAVKQGILHFSNASAAKEFCVEKDCPLNWKDATLDNCCIYHANIHSCPLPFMKQGGICGPWIPDDGKIVTHTVSQAGKMTQETWTSKVVLAHIGVTSLIAHIKIGRMHAALEATTTVLSAQVCGDDICSPEEGCALCPADCGACPMSTSIKIAIGLPVALFCSGFIMTLVWLQYQKQKMLWDESWIINFKDITKGMGFHTGAGSTITLQHANADSNASHATVITTNTIMADSSLKQSFIMTSIYDGRTIAIKKIQKKNFTLSKTIRKEVQQVRAPEVVLGNSSHQIPATDAYSFAIILVEIATRCEPFPVDLQNLDVTWWPPLPELKAGKTDTDCPNQADYSELIMKCWTHNPLMRPTFEQIKKTLEKMNPLKVSPVDMMMNLMEKYSKHLESIVAERTQDLLQEKQKTDRLLYSMLPKPVADDLRQGRTTEAQSYSNATVYFSDIVGFTKLSGASTPHQVVDFLNKLYTTFDEIIDHYDVYKVETIGDAYMVVSGVPKENGINHVSEIASMALDLVAVCHSFRIPHKPDTQLKIRAGIHSGPVVAGVVGTKMPRYCLFGDTVNTASRMESTGEALKIQCSPSAAELLKEFGGYNLTCRGVLNVKITLEITEKKCSIDLMTQIISGAFSSMALKRNTMAKLNHDVPF
ncbi:atrial natriuretic peptide receptor 1-like [Latimeria chalumnae]|uniref:atrial natriuretic peptide receptor 1-like n=1 Tax=Latimeria chalumnae TaxID=7897 RepID=UPI00313B755C